MQSIGIDQDKRSVLKEYYARYLVEVRGLSRSSVMHYFDALNKDSSILKARGLIHDDIYEVAELDRLAALRTILFDDPEFIELNERGRRMYSAGLNNYYRFASGDGFGALKERMTVLDVPVLPEKAVVVEQTVWRRSGILRTQALEMACYSCEIDRCHETFISEATDRQYMEGHHIIPMNKQENFGVSLDVYANIVCLCPVCHRKIHLAKPSVRKELAEQLFIDRTDRLSNCGIKLSKDMFINYAANVWNA